MRFEREGRAYIPPERYPRLAAACVATHDLPPLAGWWDGADLAEAHALGLIAETSGAQAERRIEKAELLEALPDQETSVDVDAPLSGATAGAVHAYIGSTNAVVALVQADDLALETAPVNVPGTDRERPNWRRKLRIPVEKLFSTEPALAILRATRTARRAVRGD
jgi:glycogen operon protein